MICGLASKEPPLPTLYQVETISMDEIPEVLNFIRWNIYWKDIILSYSKI